MFEWVPRVLRQGDGPLSVSVEVASVVIRRIAHTVMGSDVEEGGKLLGRITRDRNSTVIKVESFIDSGPGGDRSAGHLVPDGIYQDSLLELVQTLDPGIRYIGSWHSHHCNGLSELSSGDERNYVETVNDPRYDGDAFLALLIRNINGRKLDAAYYLFVRGSHQCLQVERGRVRHTRHEYALEPILRLLEKASTGVRGMSRKRVIRQIGPGFGSVGETPDPLRHLRSEDQKWLQRMFPGVTTTRDLKTGAIMWRWRPGGAETVGLQYEHPGEGDERLCARLTLFLGDQFLVSEVIPLDTARFSLVEELVDRARQYARQSSARCCEDVSEDKKSRDKSEASGDGPTCS